MSESSCDVNNQGNAHIILTTGVERTVTQKIHMNAHTHRGEENGNPGKLRERLYDIHGMKITVTSKPHVNAHVTLME